MLRLLQLSYDNYVLYCLDNLLYSLLLRDMKVKATMIGG